MSQDLSMNLILVIDAYLSILIQYFMNDLKLSQFLWMIIKKSLVTLSS